VRFAISFPPHGEYAHPRRACELAVIAEHAGWDGVFVWDHLLFAKDFIGPIADPWILLAAIAVKTERVQIGPMVTPLARRRPWKVARETVTLDHLSGGRVILGVGLGYPADSEFEQFGEDGDARTRADRLDEALEIVTGLWSGEPFSFDGSHHQVKRCTFLPRPVQSPRIPIWVGGYWPNRRPFRRAARWDGVFPGRLTLERRKSWTPELFDPQTYAEIEAYVRQHRSSTAPYDFVVGGYTTGTDEAGDHETIARYDRIGVTWWVENVHGFRGSFEQMRDRVAAGPPR